MSKKRYLVEIILIVFLVFVLSILSTYQAFAIQACCVTPTECLVTDETGCIAKNGDFYASVGACNIGNFTAAGYSDPGCDKGCCIYMCDYSCHAQTRQNDCTTNENCNDPSKIIFISTQDGNCPATCPPTNQYYLNGTYSPTQIPNEDVLIKIAGQNIIPNTAKIFGIQLYAGTYNLLAYAKGFAPVLKSIVLTSNILDYQINFTDFAVYCSVSGYVKDNSGQSLQSASVSIQGIAVSDLTNAEGFYELRFPLETQGQNPQITITASKSGYDSSSQTIICYGGYPNQLDFTLTPTAGACTLDDECDSERTCNYKKSQGQVLQLYVCKEDCTCPKSCQR